MLLAVVLTRIFLLLCLVKVTIANFTKLSQILHKIEIETYFETLLIWQERGSECTETAVAHDILRYDGKPKLLFNSSSNFSLKKMYNKKVLTLVCLKDVDFLILKNIVRSLKGYRHTPIIMQLQTNVANVPLLDNLLRYFWNKRILNVMILFRNYELTKSYYSFRPFPVFQVVQQDLRLKSQYFPQQMGNLYGYPLRTLPCVLPPRALLYYKQGKLRMIGFIGRLVWNFAKRLNATFKIASTDIIAANAMLYNDILTMTRNGTLDVPACIVFTNELSTENEFTKVVEIGKWFPMLPSALPLTTQAIYIQLFSSDLAKIMLGLYVTFTLILTFCDYLWLRTPWWNICQELLVNERALLGLTGVVFRSQLSKTLHGKLLVIQLFIAGLVFATMFSANLKALLTFPPLEADINSFEDMQTRKMKILTAPDGMITLKWMGFPMQYEDVIQVEQDARVFELTRNSLNNTMAYSVTSAMWSVFNQQQQYFARKLFRYSDQVMFTNFTLHALPMQQDSIFTEPLNYFISRLNAVGIFQHWKSIAFYDMIEAGLLSFDDYSGAQRKAVASVKDWFWIWIGLMLCLALSFVVFMLELVVNYIKKKFINV